MKRILGAILGLALLMGPALAAGKAAPTGNPFVDIPNAIKDVTPKSPETVVNSDPFEKLTDKALTDILADVTYADARAKAFGNVVTEPCWAAWIVVLTAQTTPLKDANGNTLTKPNPDAITAAEFMSEILRILQPDSTLSLACAPALQAAQKDIATLVGSVLSGGALGLFKLPVAIP
jgi:hypothetical protein